ncbi:MAG: ABC transporter permease [candidate division KSB1 bacterium]|nr:ABC transporter permease [candidate division KSB1 bacterium]MDZ7317833.1 ABC transporter permease [candidate division KSB1 bacterium]MDZ7341918.1 ABC transporter permease [candidate division KSB1 bacterium]
MSIKEYAHYFRKLASVLSLLLIMLVLTILSPHFMTAENFLSIGLQMSVIAIMAIGQVWIIIAGGIDLSVGSIMALAGVITTMLIADGTNMLLAALAGIAVGSVCGLLNGFLTAVGKLPPFISTLGMMGIARGVTLIITKGVPIFGLPSEFAALGNGRLFGVLPIPVLITIALGVLAHIVLNVTPFGRYTFAIGSNFEAARLSGIRTTRMIVAIYLLGGFLCSIAGIILASRLSTGQPTAGTGNELDVIAACVIGGASLSGGVGTIWGAILGALLIGVLRNGCNLLDISAFWQQVAIGTIIIVAVFIDQYQKGK